MSFQSIKKLFKTEGVFHIPRWSYPSQVHKRGVVFAIINIPEHLSTGNSAQVAKSDQALLVLPETNVARGMQLWLLDRLKDFPHMGDKQSEA